MTDNTTPPERIWAKSDTGFDGIAGTWLDESDGPDMAEYIRHDAPAEIVATMPAVQALLRSERDKALEEAATLPMCIVPVSPELKAALDAVIGYRDAIRDLKARPDLVGPRSAALRGALYGPRPYGTTIPDALAALTARESAAFARGEDAGLEEAARVAGAHGWPGQMTAEAYADLNAYEHGQRDQATDIASEIRSRMGGEGMSTFIQPSGNVTSAATEPPRNPFPVGPQSDDYVEAVARAFCKRVGLDPDQDHRLTNANGVTYWRGKVWEVHEETARDAIAMHLAIREVLP